MERGERNSGRLSASRDFYSPPSPPREGQEQGLMMGQHRTFFALSARGFALRRRRGESAVRGRRSRRKREEEDTERGRPRSHARTRARAQLCFFVRAPGGPRRKKRPSGCLEKKKKRSSEGSGGHGPRSFADSSKKTQESPRRKEGRPRVTQDKKKKEKKKERTHARGEGREKRQRAKKRNPRWLTI